MDRIHNKMLVTQSVFWSQEDAYEMSVLCQAVVATAAFVGHSGTRFKVSFHWACFIWISVFFCCLSCIFRLTNSAQFVLSFVAYKIIVCICLSKCLQPHLQRGQNESLQNDVSDPLQSNNNNINDCTEIWTRQCIPDTFQLQVYKEYSAKNHLIFGWLMPTDRYWKLNGNGYVYNSSPRSRCLHKLILYSYFLASFLSVLEIYKYCLIFYLLMCIAIVNISLLSGISFMCSSDLIFTGRSRLTSIQQKSGNPCFTKLRFDFNLGFTLKGYVNCFASVF